MIYLKSEVSLAPAHAYAREERARGCAGARGQHVRRTVTALIAATTLSAGTLTALIVSSTSVTAATPEAGVQLPALSAPVQTIRSEAAASSVSQKTWAYGDHERNRLDVFAPASVAVAPSAVRRPAVVLVHGGSWVKGDKSNMYDAAKALVNEGYVAIPVNYRYATQAPWPAQRDDLQSALRFVRAHAVDMHVDTDRIVVLGSSAGAEITASALTYGDGSRLARGMAMLSGPLDLGLVASNSTSRGAGLARIVAEELLRCLPAACADAFQTSSAVHRLDARDPASLVVTSRHEWVDPESSYRFHQAALDQGVASDLLVLPGEHHGMDNWDSAWPTIRTWIDRRMAAQQ